jgi:hypothetical protein
MRLILRISQPCSGPGRVLGRRICYEEHSRGNDPFDYFSVVTCYNFGAMAILIVYYEVLYCDKSNLQRTALLCRRQRFTLVVTPCAIPGWEDEGSKDKTGILRCAQDDDNN